MKTIRLGESITVLAAAIYLTGCTAQNSRWDRYLGMTAAMTQVPVPMATANPLNICSDFHLGRHFLGLAMNAFVGNIVTLQPDNH